MLFCVRFASCEISNMEEDKGCLFTDVEPA